MDCFEKVAESFIERCIMLDNYRVGIFINNYSELIYISNAIYQKVPNLIFKSPTSLEINNSHIYIFYADKEVNCSFHAVLCEESISESVMRRIVKPRIDVYDNGDGNRMLNPFPIRFKIGDRYDKNK